MTSQWRLSEVDVHMLDVALNFLCDAREKKGEEIPPTSQHLRKKLGEVAASNCDGDRYLLIRIEDE